MKKTAWKQAAVCAAAIGLSIFSFASASAAVSADEAKAIAFKHAGVDASDIYASRVHLDYEHGKQIYEIEFFADSIEYDYDIDQSSGEVLKSSSDYKYHHRGYKYHHRRDHQNSRADIGIDAASAKALARVDGASSRHMRIRPDYDHGRLVYEGEIHYGGYEYEFEIDGSTGDFIEWSKERY